MSWGTSGFGHALTTKLLMSVSAVASIAATAGRDGLSPPDLVRSPHHNSGPYEATCNRVPLWLKTIPCLAQGMSRLEAWRLLTSNLVFTSAGGQLVYPLSRERAARLICCLYAVVLLSIQLCVSLKLQLPSEVLVCVCGACFKKMPTPLCLVFQARWFSVSASFTIYAPSRD